MVTKTCKLCNNPLTARQKYCNEIHYATCTSCQVRFILIKSRYGKGLLQICRSCASKEGALKQSITKKRLVAQGLLVTPFQNIEVQKRATAARKAVMLERYGVENPAHMPTTLEKTETTNLERYGVKYPMQNKTVQAKSRETKEAKTAFLEWNVKGMDSVSNLPKMVSDDNG